MAVAVIMPRQGQSVESCIITKWLKHPGDARRASGTFYLHTKQTRPRLRRAPRFPARCWRPFFRRATMCPCLTNVCVIGNPGEDFAQFDPNGGSARRLRRKCPPAPRKPRPLRRKPPVAAAAVAVEGDMKISPRAKALAESRFADLSKVSATGPGRPRNRAGTCRLSWMSDSWSPPRRKRRLRGRRDRHGPRRPRVAEGP